MSFSRCEDFVNGLLGALQREYQSCLANPVPFGLRVDGIEATQSIQSIGNDVPLVAGKTTVVRVYISWLIPSSITVRGTLIASTINIASNNQVTLQGPNVPALNDRRNDAARSLNFVLPALQTAAGVLHIRFDSATEIPNGQSYIPTNGQDTAINITFQATPQLRVRLLGMRYS